MSLSRIVNAAVLAWGSAWGVLVTLVVCVGGHVWLTAIGYLETPADHYIGALSELALIGTAAILHRGEVGDKALHLKLDGLVRGVASVSDDLAGIEELPEGELDSLRSSTAPRSV